MGETFVALADDSSSIFWNPATLPNLPEKELAATYEDRFQLGLVGVSHFAFAYPGVGPGGVGISWTRLATTHKVQEISYAENTYTIAYGMNVWRGASIGTSINYYALNSLVKASGFGINTSLRVPFGKKLAVAGAWRNVMQIPLRYETGAIDSLPRDIRAGLVLAPARWLKLTYDADNFRARVRSHIGGEWGTTRNTALRAGIAQKDAASLEWVPSFGATLGVGTFSFDYAYENHFDLGDTHLFSVRAKF